MGRRAWIVRWVDADWLLVVFVVVWIVVALWAWPPVESESMCSKELFFNSNIRMPCSEVPIVICEFWMLRCRLPLADPRFFLIVCRKLVLPSLSSILYITRLLLVNATNEVES